MNLTTVFYNATRISLLMLMINVLGVVQVSAQGNFVMVTDAEGEQTSLRQKLVTKKLVRLRQTPDGGAAGVNVLPYNIFFQLKTTSGQDEQNGFVRVGDEAGKVLGWIESENLVRWSTRFVIQPRESDKPENRFRVDLNAGAGQMEFNPDSVPSDATVNAFITGAPTGDDADEDNGPFPVAMLTAQIEASRGAASELDAIEKMKLEVVFVIENTAFMSAEYNGKTLHERTVEMAQRFVDSYSGVSGEIPTKFGLVCFQDSVDDATIRTPRVEQRLTDNHSEWRNAIARMVPLTAKNDLPADGISALAKAVSEDVGWSRNSSKHVVLLAHSALNDAVGGGICSFHSALRGKVERTLEIPYEGFWKADATNWIGSNTSGISTAQLLQSYEAIGGSVGERMRKTRRLHAIRVGYTVRDKLRSQTELSDAKLDAALTAINNAFIKVNEICAPLSKQSMLNVLLGIDDDTFEFLVFGAVIRNMGKQDEFAPQQFRNLTGGEGLFAEMQPTPDSVKSTTEKLRLRIQSAVDLVNQVASSSVDMNGEKNEFTTPIYRMVNSANADLKVIGDPVKEGTASLRNQQGRALGEKLVMVSKNELELLKSSFDSLYTTFRAKQKRSDRQDVGGILTDLQKLLASSASGQKIDANTDLRDLITDLPLRTEALQITASDIAVMNTAAFESWLEDLQLAKEAAQTQLDTGDWLRVNDRSDLEYGFLRLSSLP
ncbi:VWA domain-containing protein [Rhodopirellula sp.]|nr:VWA domain-containing protein [Rhodopirellula sp.]